MSPGVAAEEIGTLHLYEPGAESRPAREARYSEALMLVRVESALDSNVQ
ncbi:MAG: hypothetical protein ACWGOY_05955 [Anaerolineales bacterium]